MVKHNPKLKMIKVTNNFNRITSKMSKFKIINKLMKINYNNMVKNLILNLNIYKLSHNFKMKK